VPPLAVRLSLVAPALVGAILLAACSEKRTETTVDVTLKEWSITLSQQSAPAGDITFDLKNEGPEHEHQMLIVRTDFAPDKLPTKANGTVDEGADGVKVVGRISKFDKGERSSGVYTLKAGKYVLICNLYDEDKGQKVSHYQQGMRTAFTVTEQ